MPKLQRCPGCLETFSRELDDTPIILLEQPVMFGERFTAPDGKMYCCVDCFEENGK